MSLQPFQVGERLPLICSVRDVARLFRVDVSQVHRLQRRGDLKAFELAPLNGKRRFCGRKLQAWVDGEPLADAGSRQFFGSARRRA